MIKSGIAHYPVDSVSGYDCIPPGVFYIQGTTLVAYHLGPHTLEAFDLSNMVEGVNYSQADSPTKLIENIVLTDGFLDLLWVACYQDPHHTLKGKLIDGTLYFGRNPKPFFERETTPTTISKTTIFPPPETDAEWKDRNLRTLAHCAHQFEKAVGEITPQLYTHSDAYHSANLTSEMVDRVANTGMHARLQIGYLWHQVLAAVDALLYPKPDKTAVETRVRKVFENMKTPERIKAFFHNHNREEWKKLRHQSSDERHNHRRIHIWADDMTAGDLLIDLNAKHSENGEVNHLDAAAALHTCATADYKLAASSPHWTLITHRTY